MDDAGGWPWAGLWYQPKQSEKSQVLVEVTRKHVLPASVTAVLHQCCLFPFAYLGGAPRGSAGPEVSDRG